MLFSKCNLLNTGPQAEQHNIIILESVQLRKHYISKAERHRARRSGFFGFVWFENIVFGRLAWQPPRGASAHHAQRACAWWAEATRAHAVNNLK